MIRSILVLTLLAALARSASAVDITQCGQTVVPGDSGVLTADLACGSSATGVFLGARSVLDLDGHSISAGIGVLCTGNCTIDGPGQMTQCGSGIYVNGNFRLTVNNVQLDGNGYGIGQAGRRARLTDVTASNNGNAGIWAAGARSLRGTNVIANDNGDAGIFAQSARVVLTNATVNDNGFIGLNARSAVLVDCVLTGNEWSFGTPPLLDIASSRRPQLVNTTCDYSTGPNGTWGVCSGD